MPSNQARHRIPNIIPGMEDTICHCSNNIFNTKQHMHVYWLIELNKKDETNIFWHTLFTVVLRHFASFPKLHMAYYIALVHVKMQYIFHKWITRHFSLGGWYISFLCHQELLVWLIATCSSGVAQCSVADWCSFRTFTLIRNHSRLIIVRFSI